jgi:hypothetical protein
MEQYFLHYLAIMSLCDVVVGCLWFAATIAWLVLPGWNPEWRLLAWLGSLAWSLVPVGALFLLDQSTLQHLARDLGFRGGSIIDYSFVLALIVLVVALPLPCLVPWILFVQVALALQWLRAGWASGPGTTAHR